jgi:hypothetical protein
MKAQSQGSRPKSRKVRSRDGTRGRRTARKKATPKRKKRVIPCEKIKTSNAVLLSVEELIVRALAERIALEIDQEIAEELRAVVDQWDERGIMKDVNRLIVDAAMRWTKCVKGRSEQDAQDFLKAQSDLVLICNIKRFLEPFVGA